MKLYIDVDREDPYLVTDDGEAVYVEELREDGRDTDYLNQTVSQRVGLRPNHRAGEFEPEDDDLD